jgi:hypothetical protein
MRRINPPNPFVRFISDLFRGGPNPFLASPIATIVDRRIGFEKGAKAHAISGKQNARLLAKQIKPELAVYLVESARDTDAVLDQLDVDANNKETDLGRLSPDNIKSELIAALDKVKGHIETNLGPIVRELARSEADLDKFEEDHALDRGKVPSWGKRLTRESLPFVIGVTIGEFMLNTAFFSGSMPGGMIESAGLAAMLSVVTLAFGVFLGWFWQYLDRRAPGRSWIGIAGLIALVPATLYYLLLLTLARHAGDLGDLRMFETAAREILANPFAGMRDVPALTYFIFSVAVIVFVARKFLLIMGGFPGLRPRKLAVADAEREFDDCKLGMIEVFERKSDDCLVKIEDVPDRLQILELFFKELLIDYENAVEQLKDDVCEIRDAAQLLAEVALRYVDADVADIEPGLAYDATEQEYLDRLDRYRARIDALLRRTKISAESLDKCREQVAKLTVEKRQELESEFESLLAKSETHFRRTTPKKRSSDDNARVPWLSKERA